MTESELKNFLNRIFAAYPSFVKRDSNKADIIRTWEKSLAEVSVDAANDALDRHIKQSKFVPTPADIIALVDVHGKWGSIADAIARNKLTYRRVTGKEWTA